MRFINYICIRNVSFLILCSFCLLCLTGSRRSHIEGSGCQPSPWVHTVIRSRCGIVSNLRVPEELNSILPTNSSKTLGRKQGHFLTMKNFQWSAVDSGSLRAEGMLPYWEGTLQWRKLRPMLLAKLSLYLIRITTDLSWSNSFKLTAPDLSTRNRWDRTASVGRSTLPR